MTSRWHVLIAVICVVVLGRFSRAAPADDAIAQYKAYVAAVRGGKIDDVLKLVEPVPETSKPLLNARVKQAIAVEAMKKAFVARLGPPKAGEEGWEIGGLPYDDVLKNLKGVPQGPDTMGLLATDPKTNGEGVVGWMVQRNGKWIVPAALVMDLEPGAQFVEPDAGQRQEMTKYAQSVTKAAEAVLKRLQAGEFKKPAEVQAALAEEMQKAAGK